MRHQISTAPGRPQGRRRAALLSALAAGSVPLLAACRPARPPEVVAADGVLCDISRRLAGKALPVACLLSPDDDPHRFQLSPRQSGELRQARLVLINGYGLTPALDRLPGSVPVAELAVPDSPRLNAGTEGDHGDHHDHDGDDEQAERNSGHSHGDRDPHVWHDPTQAAAMVRLVSRRLQGLQPPSGAASAAIRRHEQRMLQALTELDRWNRLQFATLPPGAGQRTLATGHRAFSSLSRAYGLKELPVVDAMSSSETLRPRELNDAVQRLRRERIRALFSEQWPVGRAMARVSQLSGVPVAPAPLRADGLTAAHSGTDPMAGDLMATLTGNTCLIVDHLGGRCDQRGRQRLIERWQAIS